MNEQTLAELEAEYAALSKKVAQGQAQLRALKAEIGRRHDRVKTVQRGTPAEIDAALRAAK